MTTYKASKKSDLKSFFNIELQKSNSKIGLVVCIKLWRFGNQGPDSRFVLKAIIKGTRLFLEANTKHRFDMGSYTSYCRVGFFTNSYRRLSYSPKFGLHTRENQKKKVLTLHIFLPLFTIQWGSE